MRQAPDGGPADLKLPPHPSGGVFRSASMPLGGMPTPTPGGGSMPLGGMPTPPPRPPGPPVYNTPGFGVGPTGELVGTPGLSYNAPNVSADYALGTFGPKGQHSIWGTAFDDNGMLGQKGTSNILWSVSNTGGQIYDRYGRPTKKVAHNSYVWMSPAQVMGQFAAMARRDPKAFAEFQLELYKSGFYGTSTKIAGGWSKSTATALTSAMTAYVQQKQTGVIAPFNTPTAIKQDGGRTANGHATFKQTTPELGFLQSNAVANGWYPGVDGTTGAGGTYGLVGAVPGQVGDSGSSGGSSGGGYSRRYYSSRGRSGGGGGGGGSAGSGADPDTLKAYATKAAQALTGADISDADKQAFVDSFTAQMQAAQMSGGAAPAVDVAATNFVKEKQPGAVKQHQAESYTDAFLNMFLSGQSASPSQAVEAGTGGN